MRVYNYTGGEIKIGNGEYVDLEMGTVRKHNGKIMIVILK